MSKKQAKKKLPAAKPAKQRRELDKPNRRAIEAEEEHEANKVEDDQPMGEPTGRFVTLPSYEEHVHYASSFAAKASEAFEASESARLNPDKVVEWQRCKVLTQLSLAHAMAAHAIVGQELMVKK